VKVGVLTCSVEGGIGYMIGSSKDMECTFKRSGKGKTEHYSGNIKKLGIDIGVTGSDRDRLAGVLGLLDASTARARSLAPMSAVRRSHASASASAATG
jgi:hypothetical protein